MIARGAGVARTAAADVGRGRRGAPALTRTRSERCRVSSGRGRTAPGRHVQEGVLVADTKDAALADLRRQQIVVTAVKEKGKEIALPKWGGKVPPKILAIFTRQFSVMIDAGLPLVQCLEILGDAAGAQGLPARSSSQVRQDVEAGSTLADAMRKHPKAFDDLYVNMVAAGEAGGILDTILQRLSTYIEKAVKLNAPGQVGADLPGRGHLDRRHRRGDHPLEGHPGVRRPVHGPRRRAAAPDPRRHRRSNFLARYFRLHRHRHRGASSSRSSATTRPTTAGASSTGSC